MKKILLILIIVFVVDGIITWTPKQIIKERKKMCGKPEKNFWQVQSIDTMKQSRDLARAKLYDKSFDEIIDKQTADIAKVGATHIAIDTPYDKEFIPFLRRWVNSARKHNLNVWFRGNWSGWEGWFGYPKNLSREKHIQKTVAFILNNPEIFENGDIFSPCPECENGNIGDPRQTKRIDEFRKFIIDEYTASQEAFIKINKNIKITYPFNGDVAKLIMDKKTTQAIGGYAVTDHYIKDPQKLANDLHKLAISSGGKVILGEFGAPILDIQGKFSEKEQAEWIKSVLQYTSQFKNIVGVNYWVNMIGSTAIWNKDGTPKKSVSVLQKAFNPYVVYGRVVDEFGRSIEGAKIISKNTEVVSDANGCFSIKFISDELNNNITILAPGFLKNKIVIQKKITQQNIRLIKKNKDWKFKIDLWLNDRKRY